MRRCVAFEGGKGFGADVMFNPLGVHFGDPFGDAEASEEGHDGFVPAFARGGEGAAFFRQKNRAIGLRRNEAGVLQASDSAIDSDVSDAEAFGEINNARFANFNQEIGNGFDVILGDFVGVFAPGLREVFGLPFSARVRIFCRFARCHLSGSNETGICLWRRVQREG